MPKKTSKYFIGIDEAGRGPLAGPVCVGLVAWKESFQKEILAVLEGLDDSKKLSPKKREELFGKINYLKKDGKLFYTYSMVGAGKIDKLGIVKCIDMSVRKCLERIKEKIRKSNYRILLDGLLKAPKKYKNQKTIIKGDEKISVISASSIVAKVKRDKKMKALAEKYPKYGFERHKGYGTKEHFQRIKKFGKSAIHRRSFLKD